MAVRHINCVYVEVMQQSDADIEARGSLLRIEPRRSRR